MTQLLSPSELLDIYAFIGSKLGARVSFTEEDEALLSEFKASYYQSFSSAEERSLAENAAVLVTLILQSPLFERVRMGFAFASLNMLLVKNGASFIGDNFDLARHLEQLSSNLKYPPYEIDIADFADWLSSYVAQYGEEAAQLAIA